MAPASLLTFEFARQSEGGKFSPAYFISSSCNLDEPLLSFAIVEIESTTSAFILATMPCYPRPHSTRTPTTLRPISAELSPLSRSDGSASLKVGNTHVLCAVHGPMSPRNSRWEKYDGGVVSVAFSRGLMSSGGGAAAASGASMTENLDGVAAADVGNTDNNPPPATTTASSSIMKSVPLPPPPGLGATERELEYFVRDALSSCILLDRYPRCVIQVVLQIVAADGSVLGTAVNCAVLALMDAGVAMGGLPVASTCVVVPGHCFGDGNNATNDGEGSRVGNDDNAATIWLDSSAEEESGEGHAIVVLVTDMSSSSLSTTAADDSNDDRGGIITSFTFGAPLPLNGLLSSVESAKTMSAAVVAFMRLAVEQKVHREVQTLWS